MSLTVVSRFALAIVGLCFLAACSLRPWTEDIQSGFGTPASRQTPSRWKSGEVLSLPLSAVWVLSSGEAASHNSLAVSLDARTSWKVLPAPTRGGRGAVTLLAAADPQDLWILCGGGPATIMMEKWLYRSSDGGQSWRFLAQASARRLTPTPDSLPMVGHINLMVFTTSSRDLIALDRASLIRTGDGGASWKNALQRVPRISRPREASAI